MVGATAVTSPPEGVPMVNTTVSFDSSTASLTTVKVAIPLVLPARMVMLPLAAL